MPKFPSPPTQNLLASSGATVLISMSTRPIPGESWVKLNVAALFMEHFIVLTAKRLASPLMVTTDFLTSCHRRLLASNGTHGGIMFSHGAMTDRRLLAASHSVIALTECFLINQPYNRTSLCEQYLAVYVGFVVKHG